MNGKNPASEPKTVLQLSKIFESRPNTPLWIVFTLMASQHLIPKYLIAVLEVSLHLRRWRAEALPERFTRFSAQMVYSHMYNWQKGHINTFPFTKSWSTLSYSRNDFPNASLPSPTLLSLIGFLLPSNIFVKRISAKGLKGDWTPTSQFSSYSRSGGKGHGTRMGQSSPRFENYSWILIPPLPTSTVQGYQHRAASEAWWETDGQAGVLSGTSSPLHLSHLHRAFLSDAPSEHRKLQTTASPTFCIVSWNTRYGSLAAGVVSLGPTESTVLIHTHTKFSEQQPGQSMACHS